MTVIAAGFDNTSPNAETAGSDQIPAPIPAAAPAETETESPVVAEPETETPEAEEPAAAPRRSEEHQIPASLPGERSSSNFDSDLDIPDFLK